MIDVYAITEHPTPPLPDVASLRAVASGGLAAVCAPAADDEATPEALWRHEQVVEALMADRDVLPARYGTRLPDDAAVTRAIAERRDQLAAALGRVRGAVELSLRVAAPGDDDRFTARARALRDIHAPLASRARAAVTRAPRPPAEILRAAFLVDRAEVDDFVRSVARMQEDHPRLRLLCTGPWPPYSFAEPA